MINLIKMEIEEKDVKVKMSVCPECGNAIIEEQVDLGEYIAVTATAMCSSGFETQNFK
jgi:hypothetical protein